MPLVFFAKCIFFFKYVVNLMLIIYNFKAIKNFVGLDVGLRHCVFIYNILYSPHNTGNTQLQY